MKPKLSFSRPENSPLRLHPRLWKHFKLCEHGADENSKHAYNERSKMPSGSSTPSCEVPSHKFRKDSQPRQHLRESSSSTDNRWPSGIGRGWERVYCELAVEGNARRRAGKLRGCVLLSGKVVLRGGIWSELRMAEYICTPTPKSSLLDTSTYSWLSA